jgi:hypothetical protein
MGSGFVCAYLGEGTLSSALRAFREEFQDPSALRLPSLDNIRTILDANRNWALETFADFDVGQVVEEETDTAFESAHAFQTIVAVVLKETHIAMGSMESTYDPTCDCALCARVTVTFRKAVCCDNGRCWFALNALGFCVSHLLPPPPPPFPNPHPPVTASKTPLVCYPMASPIHQSP